MNSFTMDTFRNLIWLVDADLNRRGDTVALVERRIRDDEGYEARIRLVGSNGEEMDVVTEWGDYSHLPRWSPAADTLAYVSNRGGPALWVYSGGQPRRVVDLPGGISELCWSPDGSLLSLVTRLRTPEDPLVDGAQDPVRFRVVRRLHYKSDGSGFWDGLWSQILVLRIDEDDRAGVRVSQVTSGAYDHSDVSWSPCGRKLAFAADRTGRGDWSQDRSIWVAQEDERGWSLRQLGSAGGPSRAPCWSPDGSSVAFVGHDRRAEAATNWDLWLLDVGGGSDPTCLTGSFDRSLEDSVSGDALSGVPPFRLAWEPDGSRIWFLATDGPCTHLFHVDVREALADRTGPADAPPARGLLGGDPTEGTPVRRANAGQRHIYRFSFAGDFASVALLASDSLTPSDAWFWRDDREHRLTRVNDRLLSDCSLSKPERMLFDVDDDVRIEGWLMRPPSAARDRHPLIAHLHRGRFGHSFRHEFQLLAGAGYAVFYLNCRGGYGYGQKFREAIHYRPMTAEVHDVVHALGEVRDLPDIDGERVGATGQSYGGHLTNWLLAHTDIFRAGVTRACISNLYSEWGTNDKGYLRWEAVGPPWDKPDFYLAASPMSYVEGITAPLLIIHSDEDYRCSLEQAEQLYTALKYLGRNTEMVIFRGENHGLVRSGTPALRYEQLRRIMDWFDRYL